MWGALFVLSGMSYATDFMEDGPLRAFCILLFMMLKAGGIVYIFMHMQWERLALKLAILGPPAAILVLICTIFSGRNQSRAFPGASTTQRGTGIAG